ncbi:MAG: undecaprenyl-diphosphate phosphatase [Desulfobacterales bacterium]|nr:undecaprenyl-diphosphate phosphatase [Desulfobacterales bacterium]
MEIYQGIVLGILQGLTEFLPVSSSGHLVLGQLFFGITESVLSFDISVHMGTLVAVLVVYRRDILAMLASLTAFGIGSGDRSPAAFMADENRRLALWIIVGSVPTALAGLFIKRFEHLLFSSAPLVGCMLILTGLILWFSRRFYGNRPGQVSMDAKRALCIGLVQGCAVIPGVSRSGSTISAGLALGLDRDRAARFSFLLSIPAIVGAQILSFKDTWGQGLVIDPATICGTIVSFVTGLIALKLLLKLVHTGKFHLFAPYCWGVGLLVLLSNLVA